MHVITQYYNTISIKSITVSNAHITGNRVSKVADVMSAGVGVDAEETE